MEALNLGLGFVCVDYFKSHHAAVCVLKTPQCNQFMIYLAYAHSENTETNQIHMAQLLETLTRNLGLVIR